MSEFKLVTLSADDNWDQLRSFWYSVYVKEMRKQPDGLDHQAQQWNDGFLRQGVVHCLLSNGQLAATIQRCNIRAFDNDAELQRLFGIDRLARHLSLDQISYSSKLVVAPQFRAGTAMSRLVSFAFEKARHDGIALDLLCCAPRLVNLYQRLGFRIVAGATHREGVGLLVPMVLVIDDQEYLREVRSPFCRCRVPVRGNPVGRAAFEATYLDREIAFQSPSGGEVSIEELTGFLQRQSAQHGKCDTPIALADSQHLQQLGITLQLQAGQTIYAPGEPANFIYVILSGTVEAVLDGPTSRRTVFVLGPGQVFGERAFRQEGVERERFVAASDCTIRVIDADEIFQSQIKTLSGQIMLLLLRAMSQRLSLLELELDHQRGETRHVPLYPARNR